MVALRDRLEAALIGRRLGARVNGVEAPRVPGTSSLAFEGVTGESLVIALDLEGIAVSAGSACSAGTIRRSPSLLAMGLVEESRSSIRVSLGPGTSEEEIEIVVARLEQVLARMRRSAPAAAGSPA